MRENAIIDTYDYTELPPDVARQRLEEILINPRALAARQAFLQELNATQPPPNRPVVLTDFLFETILAYGVRPLDHAVVCRLAADADALAELHVAVWNVPEDNCYWQPKLQAWRRRPRTPEAAVAIPAVTGHVEAGALDALLHSETVAERAVRRWSRAQRLRHGRRWATLVLPSLSDQWADEGGSVRTHALLRLANGLTATDSLRAVAELAFAVLAEVLDGCLMFLRLTDSEKTLEDESYHLQIPIAVNDPAWTSRMASVQGPSPEADFLLINDTALASAGERQGLAGEDLLQSYQSIAVAPLVCESSLVGSLVMCRRETHGFTPGDAAFVQGAADLLAPAVTAVDQQEEEALRIELYLAAAEYRLGAGRGVGSASPDEDTAVAVGTAFDMKEETVVETADASPGQAGPREQEKFTRIITTYEDQMRAWLKRRSAGFSPDEIDEVMQDVCARGWEQFRRSRPTDDRVRSWLLTLVRSAAMDAVRKRSLRRPALLEGALDVLCRGLPAAIGGLWVGDRSDPVLRLRRQVGDGPEWPAELDPIAVSQEFDEKSLFVVGEPWNDRRLLEFGGVRLASLENCRRAAFTFVPELGVFAFYLVAAAAEMPFRCRRVERLAAMLAGVERLLGGWRNRLARADQTAKRRDKADHRSRFR